MIKMIIVATIAFLLGGMLGFFVSVCATSLSITSREIEKNEDEKEQNAE